MNRNQFQETVEIIKQEFQHLEEDVKEFGESKKCSTPRRMKNIVNGAAYIKGGMK